MQKKDKKGKQKIVINFFLVILDKIADDNGWSFSFPLNHFKNRWEIAWGSDLMRKKIIFWQPGNNCKSSFTNQTFRYNSSQMSTFNFQHFWCNEFTAFFAKCWKFIASKMLEIESRHLTWGGPYTPLDNYVWSFIKSENGAVLLGCLTTKINSF